MKTATVWKHHPYNFILVQYFFISFVIAQTQKRLLFISESFRIRVLEKRLIVLCLIRYCFFFFTEIYILNFFSWNIFKIWDWFAQRGIYWLFNLLFFMVIFSFYMNLPLSRIPDIRLRHSVGQPLNLMPGWIPDIPHLVSLKTMLLMFTVHVSSRMHYANLAHQ